MGISKEEIDLNKVDAKGFSKIPGISELDIQTIFKYRTERGSFKHSMDCDEMPGIKKPFTRRTTFFRISATKVERRLGRSYLPVNSPGSL